MSIITPQASPAPANHKAAILGVPISAAAFSFLALVSYLQKEIFTQLPHGLGFAGEPVWWPLPVLAVGGVLAG